MYVWVKEKTSVDSLFYYNAGHFRFYTQRGITHSQKDFGQAFFARYLLVDFYKRYNDFESAFETKDRLEKTVSGSAADFLVVDRAKRKLMRGYAGELEWDIVFQNESFIIYDVSN
jgi:hypothetical protein